MGLVATDVGCLMVAAFACGFCMGVYFGLLLFGLLRLLV